MQAKKVFSYQVLYLAANASRQKRWSNHLTSSLRLRDKNKRIGSKFCLFGMWHDFKYFARRTEAVCLFHFDKLHLFYFCCAQMPMIQNVFFFSSKD